MGWESGTGAQRRLAREQLRVKGALHHNTTTTYYLLYLVRVCVVDFGFRDPPASAKHETQARGANRGAYHAAGRSRPEPTPQLTLQAQRAGAGKSAPAVLRFGSQLALVGLGPRDPTAIPL